MKYTFLYLYLFLCLCSYSQTKNFNQDLTVNKAIIAYKNPLIDSIIQLVSKYNKLMFTNVYAIEHYWTDETKKNYVIPDYMLKQEFAEYNLNEIKPTLINTFYPDNWYYTAQVAYSYFDTITKTTNPFAVYTFAIKNEHDSLKFFPLIDTYSFKTYKNEKITLKILDSTKDCRYIFDSLNHYNTRLAKLFSTKPIKFTCYKFNNFAELNSCIGLDVQRNYSRNENNAYCDMYNKIIYGTTFNSYFHELVHMYVGDQYIATCHNWINEGLATYLAGSGITHTEHLHYLSNDLKKHTEYNLNNFLDLEYTTIDNTNKQVYTSYKYTLGGLICKLVYEKMGVKGLYKLMSSENSNEALYKTVCQLLELKRDELNEYFRKEIYKYN